MRVTALAFVRPADLEPVLAEELSCWKEQLYWDYEPAVDLIQRHLAIRALPGYALLDPAGTAVGYAYSLVDRRIGYVGNIFIRHSHAKRQAYRLLIEALLDDLLRNPQVRRIEGQVFPFNFDFSPIFQEEGVDLIRRQYLVRESSQQEPPRIRLGPGYHLHGWTRNCLAETARLISESYQEAPDLQLCADYQTVGGCRRFLVNLMSGPGCGQFRADRSLIVEVAGGELVAVLLVSQIAPGVLMIPQISVGPAHQGRGLGSSLLASFLRMNRAEIELAALSVSSTNQGALRLYGRFGFRAVKDFFGLVLERPVARADL